MKTSLITLIISLAGFAAHAMPASGLSCVSADGKFKLEGVVSHYTGDLSADSLKITVDGVTKAAKAAQYKNYDGELFIIASLGAEGTYDDTGYIIQGNYSDISANFLSHYM